MTRRNAPPPTRTIASARVWVSGCLLAGMTLAGCRPQVKPPAPPLPAVKTIGVRVGSIEDSLPVTGSLKSRQNIQLSTKILGRVSRVLVDDGSRVTRGQLVVLLDDSDLRAQVAAAQANLSASEVRYAQARVGLPAREETARTALTQAQAGYLTAEARFRQALLNEPIRVSLAETGVLEARAAVQTAAARLRQAQESEPARITTAKAQLQTAEEVVKTAQARLQQARETATQTEAQTAADVKRAEAALAASQAALAEVKRGARDQQIAAAQAQLDLAEAQLRDAQTELNRQKMLFDGGAAPRAAVDSAQTRFDVAKAQVDSARQNLSLIREGATTEQVRQAQEAVNQAQASLSQAQAARSRVPITQQDITAALSGLAQANEGLRTAQANMSQVVIAQQDTLAARQGLNQARANLSQALANQRQVPIQLEETKTARAALMQASANLRQARAGMTQIQIARQDVKAVEAAAQSARASLNLAQINLGYTRITSPVSGVVNQKLTAPGQSATPGLPLLNIVSLDRVYMEAQVGELHVRQVNVGDVARIMVPAVSNRMLQGYVSDIIPVASELSRQFRLRITIPQSPRELTPGAFSRADVVIKRIADALVVPVEVVDKSSGYPEVVIARTEGSTAVLERRRVQAGIETDTEIQIVGGITATDRLVLNPKGYHSGQKVRAVAA